MPLMLTMAAIVTFSAAPPVEDLATVANAIAQPPKEYTSGPLWVWNDLLTNEQVTGTLDFLADAHIRQVWVHPRPGLMTPYLSDDWFALWRATLEEARKRDMLVWIYDENSYPSCFAGGLVPEAMPESRALGLTLKPDKRVRMPHPDVVAVYEKTADGGYKDVTDALTAAGGAAEGDFLVARIEEAPRTPWYAGKFHTDLLRPGVTEKFLELTLDAYRAHFGDEFGKMIPGSFTDEPHLRRCGDIHWTPDLPEQFQKRWGYNIREGLPHLNDATDAGRRFRYEYFQLINDLFIERWAKPYYEYCAKYNMDFTGHYWEHEWPQCATVPDNMAMSAWQQRPGIDILFNQYAEGVHAQFGNVRAVMELASVANQTGHNRTLCEVYGGSSAEMRFQDYKRIGDWIAVLGVNTFNEHLSDISIRGARKRDYPPTFSYHSPWMESYHVLVDYFQRVQYALSQGKQRNHCLVLEPTTTAWMYQFAEGERCNALGEAFQALVTMLAKKQAEFDLGSESSLATRGAIGTMDDGSPAIAMGECRYNAVVIPPDMDTLPRPVFELLKAYTAKGGAVFSCAGPDMPSRIDGQPDDACKALRAAASWNLVEAAQLPEKIAAQCAPDVTVALDPDNKAIVYHHRRQLAGGDVLFVVNTSDDVAAKGAVLAKAGGFREVKLDTGAIQAYPSATAADGTLSAPFELPPCGSLMLLVDDAAVEAPAALVAGERAPVAISEVAAKRLDENHLILDYVDVKAGDTSKKDLFWSDAAEITFKKNGLRGNIWDHAVQFRDELLKTAFAPDSGFEATYRFTIEGAVPPSLFAVVERADLYAITCNGKPVSAPEGSWWLDRQFGKMDLAQAAKVGENTLRIVAKPMTVFHELEAAHLVGDFAVKPAAKGFVVTPPAPLGLGAWTTQGMPLYGHRASYTATLTAEAGGRYFVSLPSWNGVVARVLVNGQDAGCIYHQPMECEVTAQMRPGENTVEVIVCGSLRNTLGPHLGNNEKGITHPGSWDDAPETPQPAGADYFTIGYGLLEPFQMTRSAS